MIEQPRPTPNDQPCAQDELIDLIRRRKQLGIERYGVGLQVDNGRDVVQDALEEALDLSIYLMSVSITRNLVAKVLKHVRDEHRAHTHASGDQVCFTCADRTMMTPQSFPCHTRCDINRILRLLGEQVSDGE